MHDIGGKNLPHTYKRKKKSNKLRFSEPMKLQLTNEEG
jgi:hypothetical protein